MATATAPATDTHHDAHDPHATNTGISNNKLAMWLFLSTECLLFGELISTYLIYKTRGNGEVLPTDLFDIPFTSVSSFVLCVVCALPVCVSFVLCLVFFVLWPCVSLVGAVSRRCFRRVSASFVHCNGQLILVMEPGDQRKSHPPPGIRKTRESKKRTAARCNAPR